MAMREEEAAVAMVMIINGNSNVAMVTVKVTAKTKMFYIHFKRFSLAFLGATKHLYNWLCPSVGRSVGL